MLEAMLRSDIPSVESCVDLTLEELNVLCQSPQACVKSKATKMCVHMTLFYIKPSWL